MINNFQKSKSGILCSVCVATYKRPILLKKLLKSLQDQALPDEFNLEIVIVDNDSEESAKTVVAEFTSSEKISFQYFNQPVKNISLTRNLTVEKATGDYLLFIDDDEVAGKELIAKHFSAITKYKADAVFGLLLPEFDSATPGWMREREFYYPPIGDTGSEARYFYTGNCFIKSSLLKSLKTPFNPKHGITGGEDTHLFSSLKRKGAYFINCREAFIKEYVPPERSTLGYLFKLSMKGGNTFISRQIEFADGMNKVSIRLVTIFKGIIMVIKDLIMIIVTLPNTKLRIRWILRFAGNMGKIFSVFGWNYQGYK